MLTDIQIENRKHTIGASDAPAICGLSPWSTPASVYRRKKGLEEFEGNYKTRLGHFLEPFIAEEGAAEAGLRIMRWDIHPLGTGGDPIHHRTMPRIAATPDYVVLDESGAIDANCQIKHVGWRTAYPRAEYGNGWKQGPPLYVKAQVEVEMACLGVRRTHILAMLGGSDLRHFIYDSDLLWCGQILDACQAFWTEAIEANREPAEWWDARLKEIFDG